MSTQSAEALAPPSSGLLRTGLVRGPVAELGVRSANGASGTKRKVLYGTMVPFDIWVEIDSLVEGNFMEAHAPGSTDKTFREGRGRMRCIHHHGRDPALGKFVLGKITDLHADAANAYYEVELFPSVPTLVLEGIEEGQYGTSIKYDLVKPDFRRRPARSDTNPKGLDELRVMESRIIEFGPCPFAIYDETTAGLRSRTDDDMMARLAEDPERLKVLAERSGVSLSGTATPAPARTLELERDPVERRYERASEYVGSIVWAMHPAVLAVALKIIGERVQGYRPSREEIDERLALGRPRALEVDTPDGEEPGEPPASPVKVIGIHGPIVPHAGMFVDMSTPGRSVEALQQELREAMAADEVKAVLLDIDSPGGSVDLIHELAAEIRSAREEKPIWALANTWAASAAYYLASAATGISVTPSGEVGSIGVYAAHEDISEMEAKAGVTTTLVSAGKYKVEGNPFEPLDEAAREEMQRKVDAHYRMFVKSVAVGRGVKVKEVERDYGQGRMVMAEKAVELGMADRVESFDQALARLEKEAARSAPATRAAALPDEPVPPSAATTRAEADEPPMEPQHSRRPTDTELYGREARPSWEL